MTCGSSKDSDQTGHLPSLISLCCPHKETTVKPVLSSHSKIDKTKVKDLLWLDADQKHCRMLHFGAFCYTFDLLKGEHSAILLTCIKQ